MARLFYRLKTDVLFELVHLQMLSAFSYLTGNITLLPDFVKITFMGVISRLCCSMVCLFALRFALA